jgi:primosomal replication protein N
MNRVLLTAQIIERKALRYTPAGLPALDLILKHESDVVEAQQPRKVAMDIKAVALGPIAEQLVRREIGRGVLLHITEINESV